MGPSLPGTAVETKGRKSSATEMFQFEATSSGWSTVSRISVIHGMSIPIPLRWREERSCVKGRDGGYSIMGVVAEAAFCLHWALGICSASGLVLVCVEG